jgi:hypothetical protein
VAASVAAATTAATTKSAIRIAARITTNPLAFVPVTRPSVIVPLEAIRTTKAPRGLTGRKRHRRRRGAEPTIRSRLEGVGRLCARCRRPRRKHQHHQQRHAQITRDRRPSKTASVAIRSSGRDASFGGCLHKLPPSPRASDPGRRVRPRRETIPRSRPTAHHYASRPRTTTRGPLGAAPSWLRSCSRSRCRVRHSAEVSRRRRPCRRGRGHGRDHRHRRRPCRRGRDRRRHRRRLRRACRRA